MAKKFDNENGPYEYERPMRSGSKLKAIAISVAALAAAGTLAAGTAYAVSAVPQSDLTSVSDSAVVSPTETTEPAIDNSVTDQDNSKEVAPPVNVIKPSFSSGDDDSDGDDQGSFQSSSDDHHDEDEAFESEDSEDD
ncbi:MAG: hypothetical protein ACKOWE_04785 [Micrococcales bacterium]